MAAGNLWEGFLHYTVCSEEGAQGPHEIILRLAREKQNIRFNGAHISFYPDFSSDVQKRRACFTDVKKRLQKL